MKGRKGHTNAIETKHSQDAQQKTNSVCPPRKQNQTKRSAPLRLDTRCQMQHLLMQESKVTNPRNGLSLAPTSVPRLNGRGDPYRSHQPGIFVSPAYRLTEDKWNISSPVVSKTPPVKTVTFRTGNKQDTDRSRLQTSTPNAAPASNDTRSHDSLETRTQTPSIVLIQQQNVCTPRTFRAQQQDNPYVVVGEYLNTEVDALLLHTPRT